MRCPNCRVETEATDFCSNCGAQLPAKTGEMAVEQSFEPQPMSAPEPVGKTLSHPPQPTLVNAPLPPPPAAPTRPPGRTATQQREWDAVLDKLTHDQDPNAAADGPANNSGTGGPAPQEVIAMGYCWPAFVFKRLWCDAHHIPMTWQSRMLGLLDNSLPDKGYVLAWQHRRFESLQQFRDTMRAWQTAAKLLPIAVGIIIWLRLVGGIGHSGFR